MGTDDLHKKRNIKLRDRKARRKENEVILIVCEGKKTEVDYLRQLKDYLKLNNVRIDIFSSKNPSPLKVVKFAKEKSEEYFYNKIYCVFDKDTHLDFNEAKQKCEQCNFEAIISNPCFEFWILLHFEYTTKPFGTNSPCKELIDNDLKKYIKDYTKNYNFANIIKQNLDIAIAHVQQANKVAESNNYISSYTFMDKLAFKFQELNNAK
ncbi:RloB domain-containing protein [Campylobacter coli]|nr:RloB domain-containing protein [Campylobacter coli]EDO6740870.1 RloB domain-containing protein [Campylobacter coli]HEA8245291.1 RloB domain-containing protein [Campylobacter coli]HEH4748005.1 RloB domain-containing protein [Campylobacter coli]HEH4748354.1 RloB domain-containing protein [Campylobacter coli]